MSKNEQEFWKRYFTSMQLILGLNAFWCIVSYKNRKIPNS